MSGGSITVNPGSPDEHTLKVDDDELVTIGRTSDPDAKRMLFLEFPEVSERHAEIHCNPKGWTVVDLGSKNGTFVGNYRITRGIKYKLKNNDRIKIALYELTVSMEVAPIEKAQVAPKKKQRTFQGHKPEPQP